MTDTNQLPPPPTLRPGAEMTAMSKADCLNIVRLLSALESVMLANKMPFPDYLHDDLTRLNGVLVAEILGEASA